jgi:uncharacterized protein (DUF433 family)
MLESMKKRIVSDPDILNGTPVFRGTRIPLDHIAGLIRKGVPLREITEDYSSLSKQDISYARVFARLVKPSTDSRTIQPIQLRRVTRAA